ncbi:MAG: ABC transporter permease [Phycisphaerales bacterium]|nr:ABC transporter permease [Phycisphaerales bacterium]
MMIPTRMLPLVLKQIVRHRTRTLLTVGGVALAMFLFCCVQGLQNGVAAATERSAADTRLVVYRQSRFCPFASRLPERYLSTIESIPGVASAVPIKIVVNNCRASLDVVTFRGVPQHAVDTILARLHLLDGSIEAFRARSDAALVGASLASRRGLKVGDRFDAAGVTVSVAGIVASEEAQDRNVAYVDLAFLQQAAGRGGLGVVTQFNVTVDDPKRLEEVAKSIDEAFRHDADPTTTRSEKAFVAAAARDIVEIARFTRWLAAGCLLAVLALVGNAIVLSVQDRIAEHAVLQTLGFRGATIAWLVIAEGIVLGVAGGVVGGAAALVVLRWGGWAMSVEGISVELAGDTLAVALGIAAAALLGALAGLVPAWRAGRREIAECFRAV